MKILEIRAKLEKQEGFDLAKFHDKLLGLGSVPLEILEEEMLSEGKVWLFSSWNIVFKDSIIIIMLPYQ